MWTENILKTELFSKMMTIDNHVTSLPEFSSDTAQIFFFSFKNTGIY